MNIYGFYTTAESGEKFYFTDGMENTVLVLAESAADAENIIESWVDSDYIEPLRECFPASIENTEKHNNFIILVRDSADNIRTYSRTE